MIAIARWLKSAGSYIRSVTEKQTGPTPTRCSVAAAGRLPPLPPSERFAVSPFLLLFLLFILVPLAEVGVFIEVGGVLGLWPTLALCLLTAAIGTACIRYQGFNLVNRARQQLDAGEAPVFEVVSGVCLLIAGILLLVPGFVTDAVGFLLLLPPFRRWLFVKIIQPRMTTIAEAQAAKSGRDRPPPRPGVIEGEFEEVNEVKGEMPPPRGGWDKRS